MYGVPAMGQIRPFDLGELACWEQIPATRRQVLEVLATSADSIA